MANLEIAQIQNAALKAAALEVDESGKKDGYIDSSEINLFTDKATALLNEKKITAQEFATLFATNEVDNTNTTDVFARVDSLHNAKNTPEALAKEAEKAKRAQIKEIKAIIAKNDKKLKLYEERLSQQKISEKEFYSEVGESSHIKAMMPGCKILFGGMCGLGVTKGLSVLWGAAFESPLFKYIQHYDDKVAKVYKTLIGGNKLAMIIGGAIGIGALMYQGWKFKSGSEQQNNFRDTYKEAYLKVAQENEQLKAQLAKLQKK